MADTNISQILAALAAQRPDEAASHPSHPQAPLQQPYPVSYPTSTPPVNGPAFDLPQPSSSGNVDLSHIRPTNSGSVSVADAVERGKSFAAERNSPYDRSHATLDDRDLRRDLQRSRSRSKSPPRRENFRDNYNPYRDERREESRRHFGAAFSRERSFSPGVSSLPGRPPVNRYGGPVEPQAQPYSNESGTETITIESNLVGLIIGRQGENLRRVETETSTRVQFMSGPESSGPHRLCKITGTRAAREHAKAEIGRIVEENGNSSRGLAPQPPPKLSGSNSTPLQNKDDGTQMMVPNRTVGLIIGRGGETIRDLQHRSGCHVNIVSEDKSVGGLRPVNLIGTKETTAVAKELILEIVDSDNKNMAQGGGNAPTARPNAAAIPGGVSGGDATGDKINDTIMVRSEAVGMIIGRGGETIKDMQNTTGCKINVAQPSGQDIEREIGLVGTRNAIEQAKRAIMDKVRAVEEKNRHGGGGRPPNQYDQYPQFQQSYGAPAGNYGQGYSQYPSQDGPQGAVQSNPSDGQVADPYAAYGGYENYMALWASHFNQTQTQSQPQATGEAYPGQPTA